MEVYINDLSPDTRRKMAILALAGWQFCLQTTHITDDAPWFYVRHAVTGEIMIGDGAKSLAGVVLNRWHRSQSEVRK
jgi:hypothetical protein